MKVLIVSSRFPWPSYSGDRMRAAIWLDAIAPQARVAFVSPPGSVPAGAPDFRFFPAGRSLARGLGGSFAVLGRGLPIQMVMTAPWAWGRAIAAAQRELGPFDATVVVLARCDPWVRPSLDGGVRILDAVDSLRRNADERAQHASPAMERFWRHEEQRLARVERDVGTAYDRVVVVSDDETSEFGGQALAITNSVRIAAVDAGAPRRYDFAFWGRLAYFANADAASWFLEEIVPALRERHPASSIVLAGAEAPRWIRAAAARAGVEVLSPIDDVATFARDVRVAIMPMRYGSGQASKLLEAAEAGCGVVTTPQALRGLPRLAPHVSVGSDAASIAEAAVMLLRDGALRAAMGEKLRRVVAEHHGRDQVLAAMAQLAGVTR